MNGIGVGMSVGLGTGIGAALGNPDIGFGTQLLFGMLFYGSVAGFIFHLYKMALKDIHLPFRRR
jgi:hypothetical protein